MGIKEQYFRGKKALLNDQGICKENKQIFKKFFEFQEYKLKRLNSLPNLDDNSYRTLCSYINKLRNVNSWFKNKPWKKLTRYEIKKVYDDLEDGKIKNAKGQPFKDKVSYYNKVIRSKPFELAGKKELAREIMGFYMPGKNEEVRFIEERTFRELVDVTIQPVHKCLLWLSWDVGENISALLQMKKKYFVKQANSDTNEQEYIVNFPKEILKRSRTSRSEITNYKETVQFLDLVLKDKNDDDILFNFGHRQALKFLDRSVKKIGAVCIPKGQKVTWKDLRSSMACHLLKEGWSTDEVNARLGHKPSSREIDKYINFMALDRKKPKKKVYENRITKLISRVDELEYREKMYQKRLDRSVEKTSKFDQVIEILEDQGIILQKPLNKDSREKLRSLIEG